MPRVLPRVGIVYIKPWSLMYSVRVARELSNRICTGGFLAEKVMDSTISA
jgi:hypothetical protein